MIGLSSPLGLIRRFHGDKAIKNLSSFLPIGGLLSGTDFTDWIVVLGDNAQVWLLRQDGFGVDFANEDDDYCDYDMEDTPERRQAQRLPYWQGKDVVHAGSVKEVMEGNGFKIPMEEWKAYPGPWRSACESAIESCSSDASMGEAVRKEGRGS
ncbi:hypothetical protein DL98DRAFT_516757 [Cadophora sp. DSE1049]|nr:hypothetical protein DL98DRAFT_516757 [Cadophora sp. DSE1049]